MGSAKSVPRVAVGAVDHADRGELLRVPGLGPTTVDRILKCRMNGGRVNSLTDIGRAGKRLTKAAAYLKF